MEIRYCLQLSDLDGLHRHLLARSRAQNGSAIRRMIIWAIVGALAAFAWHLPGSEDGSWYQYLIWVLPLTIFWVSVFWLPIWQRTNFRKRWIEQFAGEYIVNLTPAGIAYAGPGGRSSFYAWSEIQAFETADTDLYVYLRRDVAIPIPLRAFECREAAANFAEKVRDFWLAYSENTGKTLPEVPGAGNTIPGAELAANLLLGARVAFFIDYDVRAFRVGFGLFVQLLLLDLLCTGVVDYVDALPVPEFNLYGVSKHAASTLFMLAGAACISNLTMQRASLLRLLVMFSASEVVIHLIYFSSWLAVEHWWPDFRELLWTMVITAMVWTLAVLYRIVHRLLLQPAPSALMLISIYGFFTLALSGLLPSERLYYSEEPDEVSAEYQAAKQLDVEDLFYRQPSLVENEVATLQAQRAGKTDLYFVGFAGQANERVFFNEVSYARNLLDTRFNTAGRSLVLLNHIDTVNSAPLANRHNLKAVLQGIGRLMDAREDVLFLFLSSHGAKDQKLSVSFWPFRLNDLTAAELKLMLDEAGIRNRVIAVSACYSGGFLDVLKDDNTLVLTASSRDHVSYGCGDFTQYTYFGEAFFVKSLANGDSFISAFEQARQLIEERERSEGLDASAPQIDVGRNIEQILQKLEVAPATAGNSVKRGWIEAGLPFGERVQQARRFEQDADARYYAKQNLFPAMNTVMSASLAECLKHSDASTEKFTLVANIQADGAIVDVDYLPATNTAECFSEAFRTLHLAPLPDEFGMLPVFFDMSLSG